MYIVQTTNDIIQRPTLALFFTGPFGPVEFYFFQILLARTKNGLARYLNKKKQKSGPDNIMKKLPAHQFYLQKSHAHLLLLYYLGK